ncbi:FkbM family methyltransferase [Bizionia argentinensis JUB59]|uniref:FkbM family methyltransferase n=1 Tax=Bizionia argentinensis JUB59 TaxID=1046627 RepID=G2EAS8_9FLAO|nr:FkbM family methyltransferase [Bizionia argentinensis]EGV44251.1 FkbM family methyltransferase [Bizionia argentinensis JUB59]
MKKSHRKFVNRIINKLYGITKNESLYLYSLNIATKLFKHSKNSISFDKENNCYWLKNRSKFLQLAERPYFDFSEEDMRQRCQKIFCKYYSPQAKDVILDIGAGIGTEVCFFVEAIKKEGKLYNIEASPTSFNGLEQTVLKNNFKNCYNFNLAISNNEEPIWIEENDNYVVNSVNKNAVGVRIKAITIDQFVTINKITKINLLKVNIEGAEYDMIDGMKDSIHIIENVAISCHDFLFKDGNKIENKVSGFLRANNFQVFYENSGNQVLDSWVYGKKIYN